MPAPYVAPVAASPRQFISKLRCYEPVVSQKKTLLRLPSPGCAEGSGDLVGKKGPHHKSPLVPGPAWARGCSPDFMHEEIPQTPNNQTTTVTPHGIGSGRPLKSPLLNPPPPLSAFCHGSHPRAR